MANKIKSKKQQKSKHAISKRRWNRSRQRKTEIEKAEVLNWQGFTLAKSGQYEAAIAKFEQALQFNTEDLKVISNYGAALRNLGQLEAAIEKYKYALQINPKHFESLVNYGLALSESGQHEAAIEKYTQALQINPKHIAALHNYGTALIEAGQYELAIEKFEQALQLDPHNVKILYNCGTALNYSGQYEKSIEKFREALKIDPNNFEVLDNYGTALVHLGYYEMAIEKFEQALHINPQDIFALTNYGAALSNLGQYKLAIEKYDQALHIIPTNSATLINYGYTLTELKQYEKAIEKFEYSLTTDSISSNYINIVYLTLGILYYRIKSERKGDWYFNLAIERSDNKDVARIQVAQQIFAEHPYSEKGVAILQEITETSPYYQEAFKSLTLNLTPKAFFEMFKTRLTDDETLKDTELLNRALYHKIANEIAILNEILYGIVFEYHIEDESFSEILNNVSHILREITRRRELEKAKVQEIPADDYDAIMITISKTAQDISDFVNNELAVIEEDVRFMLDNSSNTHLPSEELEEALTQITITQQALNDLKSINEGIKIHYSRFPVEQLFENWEQTPKLRHTAITVDIQNRGSLFSGDEQKIKSFLKELVENSLRHNPGHSDLQIQMTSKDALRQTDIFPDTRKYLVITYHDNGKGIPPDKKDWVFLPLKTTSDIGSGLGLFMIKRTLEKMNGYIIVDTNSKGITFEMAIPYPEGDEQ